MKSHTSFSRFAATVTAFAAALSASCAFSAEYAKSFDITFPGYTGSETLTNFPVLVRLSAARNGFKYAKCRENDGGDVRFFDADGVTVLPSEVDTWDPNGESLVWVRVPRLTSTTNIICRYGSFHPDPVTPSDVWSDGYIGVWHMSDTNGSQGDSTALGTTLSSSTTYRPYMTEGVPGAAGKAAALATSLKDGDTAGYTRGGYAITDTAGTFSDTKALTVEIWAIQREIANDKYLFSLKKGSNPTYSERFTWPVYGGNYEKTQLNYTVMMKDLAEGTSTSYANVKYQVSTNGWLDVWRHFALTVDNVSTNILKAFENGVLKQYQLITDEDHTINEAGAVLALGNTGSSAERAFPGTLDEFRISNVARSADWLKATYCTVADDGFIEYTVPNEWGNYARRFTIQFPDYAGETLADFPVLVKLSEADIEGFLYSDFVRADGGDLRFADAAGNLLAHEIDTWDENGVSAVWVKVPSLNASTVITCYYGFALPPEVNHKAVWSNGYLGVWHLGESARPLRDSGANGLDFTAATSWGNRNKTQYWGQYDICNSYGVAGGAVGNAVAFDAAVSNKLGGVIAPDETGIIGGLNAISVEIWAKCASFPTSAQYLLCKRRTTGSSSDPKYSPLAAYYALSSGTPKQMSVFGLDDSAAEGNDGAYTATTKVWPSSNTMPNFDTTLAGKWNYHVFQYDNACTYHTNYLNGAYSARTSYSKGYPLLPGNYGTEYYALCLANNGAPSTTAVFDGALDELRISNVARSAAWVNATYRTIADHDSFTQYSRVKDNNPNLSTVIFYR